MPRPRTRTSQLVLDDVNKMKALFGTARNAYHLLSLDGVVPFSAFSRALAWEPVRPEEADEIEDHWQRWQARFIVDYFNQSDYKL